jgi:TM2 domain-containing membrane protein YozV
METNQPKVRSRSTYVVVGLVFGLFGIHNFYVRRWRRAIAQLFVMLLVFVSGSLVAGEAPAFPLLALALWVLVDLFTVKTDGVGVRMRP